MVWWVSLFKVQTVKSNYFSLSDTLFTIQIREFHRIIVFYFQKWLLSVYFLHYISVLFVQKINYNKAFISFLKISSEWEYILSWCYSSQEAINNQYLIHWHLLTSCGKDYQLFNQRPIPIWFQSFGLLEKKSFSQVFKEKIFLLRRFLVIFQINYWIIPKIMIIYSKLSNLNWIVMITIL